MSKELFVLVPDDEEEDHSSIRYRFPLSTENIAVTASHSSDADVTYIVRESVSPLPLMKKEVSPWRQRFGERVRSFTSAAKEIRNKQIRWKQVWDSIGMVLLVLQLCAHVLTQINGVERSGDAKIYSSSNTCPSSSSTYRPQYNGTADSNKNCIPTDDHDVSVVLRTSLNIHFIVDVYFIVDWFVRYRLSYLLHRRGNNNCQGTPITTTIITNAIKTETTVTTTFWRTSTFYWFLVDFLLIFPHGFCWKLFEARPALQLLTIKEGRKRPILDFFIHRNFRLNVLKLIRDHRAERKVLHSFLPWLKPGTPTQTQLLQQRQRPKWLGFIMTVGGKAGRVVTWSFRMWRRVQKFSFWSLVIQFVSWTAMSVRALSRLNSADLI